MLSKGEYWVKDEGYPMGQSPLCGLDIHQKPRSVGQMIRVLGQTYLSQLPERAPSCLLQVPQGCWGNADQDFLLWLLCLTHTELRV